MTRDRPGRRPASNRSRSPTLTAILDQYSVLDVSVQDPPLESVIARVFEEGEKK